MISIKDLTVRIGEKVILDHIDLNIPKNSWTCLVGPNGAGKTTLLKALLGVTPYSGSLRDDNAEVYRNQKRNVAFVPQQPQIPAGMTVSEYVMMGRSKRDGWGNESVRSRSLVQKANPTVRLAQSIHN